MEVEDRVFDDAIVPESPVAEMEGMNFGIDTEFADDSGGIVLDSEDEEMRGTAVVGNKTERRVWKRRYAGGCIRRQRNSLWRLDSDRHGLGNERSCVWTTSACDGTSRLKHRTDADRTVSSEQDDVDKMMNVGKISREASTRDALEHEGLNLCRSDLPKLNYIESQEPGDASEADALKFVDHYLSSGDQNAFHHVETGVLGRSTSPRILRSNGPQNLARIKNRTSVVKKLDVFDWTENLSDNEETSSVEKRSKLSFKSDGNEPRCISVPHRVVSRGIQKQKSVGSVESNFQVEDVIGKGVYISEKAMDNNLVTELGKEVTVNSPQKRLEDEQSKLDVVSTYDVGFDTQVAAEAMEALFYAPPPSMDHFCAHHSPQKALQSSIDPSNTVLVDNSNEVASNSEDIGKQLTHSAENVCYNLPGKLFTKKRTERRYLRNTSTNTEACNEKIFSKQLDVNFSSFEVSKCGVDDKEKKGIREVSSGAQRNRKQSSSCSLKRFTEQSFINRPEEIKLDFPKKRRKKNDVIESDLTEPKKATEEVGISNKLKFEDWSHPRGKRTPTCVHRHSIGYKNQNASCAEDNGIKHPVGNNATLEKTGPVQSGRRCQRTSKNKHSSISSMQFSGNSGSPRVSNCKSAITSDKGVSCGHVGDNSAKPQPFKSDDLVSLVPDVMSTNRTLKNRNHIESYSSQSIKKGRRGKNQYGSSLTKELSRLGYAELLPDFKPKGSRRRGHANIRVLFSQNLDENIIKRQKKIVTRLGFSIASCTSGASHFVADKFLRTKNMLEAIAIGIPVVTHLWLESCGQAGSFVDDKIFILRDDKKEKDIGFCMPVSLALSRQRPLLRDQKVFITPNVKPSKQIIQSLVNSVQGQEVAETEDITTEGQILVISSEEDYATCVPFLHKGIAVYSSELLLNGIITQRLELERFQLFKNFEKKDWPLSPPI